MMKKLMKIIIFILILIPKITFAANAQGYPYVGTDFKSYFSDLLKDDSLVIEDVYVTSDCGYYNLGKINNAENELGIDSGIVISSGKITDQMFGNPKSIMSDQKCNNIIVELILIPKYNTIKFNYVYASEEYPDINGSPIYWKQGFHDDFVISIGNDYCKAINYIPNSNVYIKTSTINEVINNHLYIITKPGVNFSFSGKTKVMDASTAAKPGKPINITFHIKDILDYRLDSIAVIKSKSLYSDNSFTCTKEFADKNYGKCCQDFPETCPSELCKTIEKKETCDSLEYAKSNPEKCCDYYPEICCLESSFIDNTENWNKYFVGNENEWRKNICCANETFKGKYVDKCAKPLTCADAEYEKEHHCSCKKLVCDENFPKDCIGKFIYDVYQIIKIVATILIVVMTTLDFVKAMSAQDDEKMKKSINDAKKRVIIVVVLLFGPTIINFLLGLFSNGTWSTCGIK